MEIAILRKETTGSGGNLYSETETIAKYEIMDGAPVRGNDRFVFHFFSFLMFIFIR